MATQAPPCADKKKLDVQALAAMIRRGLQGPGPDREGLRKSIAALNRLAKRLTAHRKRVYEIRMFLAQLRGKMAIMLPQAKALQDRLRAARACGGRPSPEFRAKLQEMHALAEGIRDYVTNPSLIPKSPLSPQAIEALNRIDLSRLRSGGRSDSAEAYALCFAEGTPVRMADGGWKPIETIQPGELVLCVPEDDPEGEPSARPVVQSYHNEPVEICEVRLSDALIRTTPGHPFYVLAHGWTAASDLRPGDELRSLDGSPLTVTTSQCTGFVEPVFNLQIADHHTYFVGTLTTQEPHGVLVHNQSPGNASGPFPSGGDPGYQGIGSMGNAIRAAEAAEAARRSALRQVDGVLERFDQRCAQYAYYEPSHIGDYLRDLRALLGGFVHGVVEDANTGGECEWGT